MPAASPSTRASRDSYRLPTSSYDRTASLLVALLAIVGMAVAGLVIIYFASRLVTTQVAIPVVPIDPLSATPEASMGMAEDLEPPGLEDAPDINEPSLVDTLNAVASAISSNAAVISQELVDSNNAPGKGKGLGNREASGDGGTGTGPQEPQREIRFKPKSLEEYIQWYTFFGIELGVISQSDNLVYYGSNFQKDQPDVRSGPPGEEKRLYTNSTGGPLAPLDRQLADKAGISSKGNYMLQFYPPQTQGILLGLEKQKAGNRPLTSVTRTIFRVEAKGGKFQFKVEDQLYY